MGRPPDPQSAPTPAGTTAMPELIPDLVSKIPWPHWAFIVAALGAGILAVSCLFCAICCCCQRRRRRRKKLQDKEVMSLGSARSSTTTHLVQPDVENLESSLGDPRQWGRMQLSLEYNFGSQEIRVGLKQAADLRAEGTADPYARVSVSTQAGRRHETKVHHGTLCPMFEETFSFHVPLAELPSATLQVQVLDFNRFSEHKPLGELCLPLGTLDPQHVVECWYQLGPPGTNEAEQMGELCLSLRYVPSSGYLTVVVLEARGLSPELAESYVKVQLMLNQKKWKKKKTSSKKGTTAPYFNEAFTFLVPFSQVQSVDLVLAIWARGLQLRAEPLGKVLLGPRASGQPLQHWADMLAHARRPIAQWHRLQPAKEVDRILALQPRLRLPVPRP
ncbi:PREDICTED: synaptotagmin-8 isoform X2 [Chinchilla lanigera]|uniref:Synaptotagmin-8 n=2 Tax=Chinchilla lanigera TaxID=34839 RepID=A0A8C2W1Y7_CHILA|nr:PREDICTED: synaptotagmin-8 isoform X2 [Chinchilla lanigera]XP_013369788.1 PREDICTED: synaptotagmin-8 isoform X2 [Chinchilla lanigera]